ncbi:MAG: hypothetical protein LJE95_13225 [Acidobacteria bacterium]|jgi:hypothetical protein|nr:hypothetical protein [Acidobacteriota bacterium]
MRSPRYAAGWFAASLALYGVSAARVPMWADSSKLTLYAIHGYFPSLNPGDHPGWSVIARVWLALVPWLDPARATHLLSALAGAAAVALTFTLALRWSRELGRAHTAAALLLVSHSLWWCSALTESYSIALALALAAAVLADSTSVGARLAGGVAFGLAFAAHPFSIVIAAPALARHWRTISLWLGTVAGTAPVWLGVLGVPLDPLTGHRAGGSGSLGWHVKAFLHPTHVLLGLAAVTALVVLNLGPLGIAALARGRGLSRQHPSPRLAVLTLAAYAVLVSSYSLFRLHVMVLFLVAGLILTVGPRLSGKMRTAHVVLQAAAYILLPMAAGLVGHADLGVRRLPDRNNAWYFLCPIKVLDAGPELYARSLLSAAPPRATIVADFNPGSVLVLTRELARTRPDLDLLPTAVDEALAAPDPAAALAGVIHRQLDGGRPVVLADRWEPYYRTRELAERFALTLAPCGSGWLVIPDQLRREKTSSATFSAPMPRRQSR